MKKIIHSVILMKERIPNPNNRALRLVFGLIILFVTLSLVQVQCTAASPSSFDSNSIYLFSNQDEGVASGPESPVDDASNVRYEWNTIYSNNVTVSGLGSSSDTASGDCTLYDDATFICHDDTNGWDFAGTYIQTGNKIKFTFDSDSLQEFADMLTNWAEEVAYGEGADISDISIDFTSVKITQMTISKKTGIPGNVTVTIKGKVSAILEGKFIKKNFSYSSKVRFQ